MGWRIIPSKEVLVMTENGQIKAEEQNRKEVIHSPDAIKVLEKAIKEIGGRRRLQRVESLTATANYASFVDTIFYRAPDMVMRHSKFPWGELKVGFDGGVSWHTIKSGSTVEDGPIKTPAIGWLFHKIDCLLLFRLPESDADIEYLGQRVVVTVKEDETVKIQTDCLQITFPDQWMFTLYFDRDSGLLVKSEYEHEKYPARRLVRFLRRYRSVHKVKLPHTIIEINPHSKERTKTRVSYEVNPKLHKRMFCAPARGERSEALGGEAAAS
jgi:hypothetical protein